MPRMLAAANMRYNRIIARATDAAAARLFYEIPDGSGEEVELFPASPWEYLWAQRERDWWIDNFEKKANIIAISMVAGHKKTADRRALPLRYGLHGGHICLPTLGVRFGRSELLLDDGRTGCRWGHTASP